MPTNFYARYVPSAAATTAPGKEKSDSARDISARASKRKKIDHNDSVPALEDGHNGIKKTSNSINSEPSPRSKVNLLHNPANASNVSEEEELYKLREQDVIRRVRRREEKKKEKESKVATLETPTQAEEAKHRLDKHKSIRAKYQEASKISEEALQNQDQTLIEDDEGALERIQSIGLQPLPQPDPVPDGPKAKISSLPEWMKNPVHVNRTAKFARLKLSKETVKRLSAAKFRDAFAIQTTIIPMLLSGPKQHRGDICVAAATGSGKTLAYTLPIIEALKDKPVTRLRALIIVPTRELVAQVHEVFCIMGSSLNVGTAVGSKSLREERDMLIEVDEIYNPNEYKRIYGPRFDRFRKWETIDTSDEEAMDDELPQKDHVFERSSKVDVLVCTPGRLVDHLRSTKGFTLKHLQWLVVDEADRLLDQSFQQWLDIVTPELERKPANDDSSSSRYPRPRIIDESPLRKVILSATMTRDYSKLLALNLQNPILVTMEGKEQDSNTIQQTNEEPILTLIPKRLKEVAIAIKDAAEKPLYLLQLIRDQISLQDLETHGNGVTPERLPNAESSNESSTSEDTSSDDEDTSSQTSTDSSRDQSSKEGARASDDGSSTRKTLHGTSSPSKIPPEMTNKPAPREDCPEKHGMLVFTNTNESALRLCRLLVILQPSWTSRILPLTKSIGTSSGRKALTALRQHKADIIIATDLASRGLDLKNLAHVVNYDMPKSLNAYIHRVGRTARAGQSGVASTLVCHHEARWFWHEIGQCSTLGREQKVKRQVISSVHSDADRKAYERALEILGREAKGG